MAKDRPKPQDAWDLARFTSELAYFYQCGEPSSAEDQHLIQVIREIQQTVTKSEESHMKDFRKSWALQRLGHILPVFKKINQGEILDDGDKLRLLEALHKPGDEISSDQLNSFIPPTKDNFKEYYGEESKGGPKEAAMAWLSDRIDPSRSTLVRYQRDEKAGKLKNLFNGQMLLATQNSQFIKIVLNKVLGLGKAEIQPFLNMDYDKAINLIGAGYDEPPEKNKSPKYSSDPS